METNSKPPKKKIIIARKSEPRRRIWLWWVLGVLGFTIGVAGGVSSYVSQELGMGPVFNPFSFQNPFRGRGQVNILLIGKDDIGAGLADTLMVARVDVQRRRVGAVSIPRDTRANIAGQGVQKVNAAHAFGGTELTQSTVSQLLGIPIDYYIEINSRGLAQMVDAADGIEIDVEKRMRYRDRAGGLSIRLEPGLQVLNGEQAVGYVRFRHDALGDIGRMRRQQSFVRALAKRLTAPGMISRIPALVQALLNTVDTNLSAGDLAYLARLARGLGPEKLVMATLPGEPRMVDGLDCFQLSSEGVRQTIAEVLYGKPCAVKVIDASGNGRGERVIKILEENGVQVISTLTGPVQASSRIINHHGRPETGRNLLQLISCNHLISDDDPFAAQDFTIEVGEDFGLAVKNSSAQ